MDNKQKNAFLKCMDIVDKIVREICIFLMFVMLVLVLLQVVSRYLLPVSLSWTEELARFTMLADLSGKQPYRTKVFLYQSYIYH